MRISDWSSDVCSSDLRGAGDGEGSVEVGQVAVDDGQGGVQVGQDGVEVAGVGLDERGQRADRVAAGAQRCGQLVAAGHEEVEDGAGAVRSEEHTSELRSLMRISYAVFCLKKKTRK